MRYLLVVLLVCMSEVYAEESVFFDGLREDMNMSVVFSEVERALERREWRILERSDNGVGARIRHRGVDANVLIYAEGGRLLYRCSGTREVMKRRPAGGSGGTKKRKVTIDFCPEKWIKNVKSDLERVLRRM